MVVMLSRQLTSKDEEYNEYLNLIGQKGEMFASEMRFVILAFDWLAKNNNIKGESTITLQMVCFDISPPYCNEYFNFITHYLQLPSANIVTFYKPSIICDYILLLLYSYYLLDDQ